MRKPIPDALPRPDLAMALARPGRAGEVSPDRRPQGGVRDRGLRPAAAGRPRGGQALRRLPGQVERRSRHDPDRAHPRHAVGAAGGRRDRPGHHRPRFRPKGPGDWPIFARRRILRQMDVQRNEGQLTRLSRGDLSRVIRHRRFPRPPQHSKHVSEKRSPETGCPRTIRLDRVRRTRPAGRPAGGCQSPQPEGRGLSLY